MAKSLFSRAPALAAAVLVATLALPAGSASAVLELSTEQVPGSVQLPLFPGPDEIDEPGAAGHVVASANARPVMTRFGWRAVFNFYRATAGLGKVTASNPWNGGGRQHSRYMVKNRTITHTQDPRKPHYTREGSLAGRNGNLTLAIGLSEPSSQRDLIERWMAAPFHAAGMIDASLRRSGFGVYREKIRGGGLGEGATLDILRGRNGRSSSQVVVWPAHGMQVPIRSYSGNEWPDPLASCPGYRGSAGLPILALFPSDVKIVGSSFRSGAGALDHCVFDRHSYRNAKAADQRYARNVLASRNTVVLIPRSPLEDFNAYTASLTTASGQTIRWTFTIGEVQPPVHPRIVGAVASRAFQERTSFTVAWTATDESGIAAYDVRYRQAPLKGKLGKRKMFVQGTSSPSRTFNAQAGHTYCFSVRATDRAGNRSGWGKETCTTMPLRATDLRGDPIWAPVVAGDHYSTFASMSLSEGATLSTGKVRARRIAVQATRVAGAGVIEVRWNNKRLARIDLSGPGVGNRAQYEVASFKKMRTGTVTIRVLTANKPVIIEGLGVGRR